MILRMVLMFVNGIHREIPTNKTQYAHLFNTNSYVCLLIVYYDFIRDAYIMYLKDKIFLFLLLITRENNLT